MALLLAPVNYFSLAGEDQSSTANEPEAATDLLIRQEDENVRNEESEEIDEIPSADAEEQLDPEQSESAEPEVPQNTQTATDNADIQEQGDVKHSSEASETIYEETDAEAIEEMAEEADVENPLEGIVVYDELEAFGLNYVSAPFHEHFLTKLAEMDEIKQSAYCLDMINGGALFEEYLDIMMFLPLPDPGSQTSRGDSTPAGTSRDDWDAAQNAVNENHVFGSW
jgi:hypothetical protein